jgi:hypothetical protein
MTSTSFKRLALVLALLILVITLGLGRMYWPLVQRPAEFKFFGYLDAWVYTGPVLFYGDRVEEGGEFPLWNPYVFLGQPIAGNPQYLLFYPPNFIRSLLTPGPTPFATNTGIDIVIYLHVLWAGIGAYFLGRTHGLSRLAAATTGILFVFSAPYTQRLFLHHHLIFVVSWLPWNCALLRKAIIAETTRRAFAWSLLLGLAFGMSLLAGSPQLTYMAGFGLGLYWLLVRLVDLVYPAPERAVSIARRARGIGRDIAFGGMAVGVAALISTALLIPSVQLVRETPRVNEGGEKVELKPSVEKWELLEVLSVYLGSENHESAKAIGAGGLMLALLGLFSKNRRDAIAFAGMTLLLLDASLVDSRFMLSVVAKLAPFPIAAPGRMMMVGVLPLSLLAGMGIDALRAPLGRPLIRLGAAMALLFAGGTMLEAAYRRLSESLTTAKLPVPLEVLAIPAAALIVIWFALSRPGRTLPVLLVAGLAITEPIYYRAIWCYNMTATRAHFFRQGPVVAHDTPDFPLTGTRESSRFPNTPLYTLSGEINGYDPLSLRGYKALVAPKDTDPFWRGLIETAKDSNLAHLMLKRTFWLAREYVKGPIPERPRLFPPTTTAYVMDPPALHVPEVAAAAVPEQSHSENATRIPLMEAPHRFSSGQGVQGERFTLRLPRYEYGRHVGLALKFRGHASGEIEVRMPETVKRQKGSLAASVKFALKDDAPLAMDVPLPDVAIGMIEIQPFYMRTSDELVLESVDLVIDESDEFDHIRYLSQSANTVEIEVRDLPDWRILSYIDFDFPGWRVYVDGAEAPMLRTFSYFKGVELAPGTHRVRFEYRSPIVFAGMAISIVGFVAVLAALAWAFRRGGTAPAQ